jgi:hypothetical protein
MPENIYQFQCRTKDENRREVVFTGTSTHHDPSWSIMTHHDLCQQVSGSCGRNKSNKKSSASLPIITAPGWCSMYCLKLQISGDFIKENCRFSG